MNYLLNRSYSIALFFTFCISNTACGQNQIPIDEGMIYNVSARGESKRLVDQQELAKSQKLVHGQSLPGAYPWDKDSFVENGWNRSFIGAFNAAHVYQNQNLYYPIDVRIDLGATTKITGFCLADLHGEGQVKIEIGHAKNWKTLFNLSLDQTYAWNCKQNLNATGQFLKFTFTDPAANLGEIILYGTGAKKSAKTTTQKRSFPLMNEFMGVNINTEDPPHQMALFEFVREYHDWHLELGDHHPNDCNIYRWNPSNAYEGWHFDRIYQDYEDNQIQIAADLKSSIPALLQYTVEDKPISKDADPSLPSSYTMHAEYMYQFAARYGRKKMNASQLESRTGEDPQSGLGLVQYVEDWNEQDKYWMSGTGTPQQEAAYFSPFEYAAMLSADYDGHEASLQMHPKGNNCTPSTIAHPVGVKNADPSMKVVMGGISSLNLDYIKAIQLWAKLHRKDQQFPADVLNFHHYSNNYGGQTNPPGTSAKGVSPEEDKLYERLKSIVDYRNQYLPHRELWLSEFGYDTHPDSPQQAPAIGSFSSEEVQGQWIVRSFLAIAAAGFDKAQLFTLTDDYKGNPAQLFSTCGLLRLAEEQDPFTPFPEFDEKRAWYYVYAMKRALDGHRFHSIIPHQNPNLRIYKFVLDQNMDQAVYVLWSATSQDQRIKNVRLTLEANAQTANQINLKAGDIDGEQQKLSINNQSLVISEVSERPIFVVVNQSKADVESCNCSIPLDPSMLLTEGQVLRGNPYHLIDEQLLSNGQARKPLCGEAGKPEKAWIDTTGKPFPNKETMTAVIDLKKIHQLSGVSVFDLFNEGWLRIEYGSPDQWKTLSRYQTSKYNEWKSWLNLHVQTRYLRIVYEDPQAIIGELVLCGYPID